MADMKLTRRTPDAAEAYLLREFVAALTDPEDARVAGIGIVPDNVRASALMALNMADAARVLAAKSAPGGDE